MLVILAKQKKSPPPRCPQLSTSCVVTIILQLPKNIPKIYTVAVFKQAGKCFSRGIECNVRGKYYRRSDLYIVI